jgi:hypothetical protein
MSRISLAFHPGYACRARSAISPAFAALLAAFETIMAPPAIAAE